MGEERWRLERARHCWGLQRWWKGAGMVLATDPGSSNASTGAHALGPLTLPGTSHGTQQGVLRLISATLMHEATV